MKVSGTWEGEYRYGAEYGPTAGTSIEFTMSVTQLAKQSAIRGYVRDGEGGIAERGRIAGRSTQRTIDFVKTMPVDYLTDGAGNNREISETIEQELGIRVTGLSAHRIRYRGQISESGETMTGTWEVLPLAVETAEGSMQFPASGTGTWQATRVSPKPSAV